MIKALLLVVALASDDRATRSLDYAKSLPACTGGIPASENMGAVDTSRGFALSILGECGADPKPEIYFHGGRRWLCGKGTAEVAWGYYGPSSFESGEGSSRCHAVVNGLDLVVIRYKKGERHGVRVWYLVGGDWYEPMIGVESPTADETARLSPIAFSGRLRGNKE